MTIKAVLFDLWGTLVLDSEDRWRPRQVRRAANVARVLIQCGVAIESQVIESHLDETGRALSRLHDQGRDVSSAQRVALFLEQLGPELSNRVPDAAFPDIESAICGLDPALAPRLADGAAEALIAIHDLGMATALISNAGLTSARYLRGMIDAYGLAGLLDVLVFSDEIELAKPDQRIFEHALAGLGVEASSAVFVGDSPHHDVFGARNAGIFAFQIGHHNGPPPTGYTLSDAARPNAHIAGLADLGQAIDALVSQLAAP